ncbi:hypothetical protein HPB48_000130 [Haemaphysalis longicornis]|uniref:Transposase Tc1-like domain-containing protein n=1 Tax=Haemaphysalis longicornis TaxID=44386 RepID=A0A9J6GRJ2_HAELO|nr:hypothetical protein HPB48_000130 [Haemaphysalis longicornis]
MPGVLLAEGIQIVTMCGRGVSQKEIANITGHAYFSVNRFVNAYRQEGRLENLPRGIRPRATTADEDERILNAARRDPILTANEILNELGLTASTSVVRNRLRQDGLHSRVTARNPLLSGPNKAKRLLSAGEHQD